MNQMNYNTIWPPQPPILPFMDDRALGMLHNQLGLSMSMAELRTCRDYYLRTKRSPLTEELLLLDHWVVSQRRHPHNLCLAEMTTQSKTVADIFADVMLRRRQLMEDTQRPVSLQEIADIAEQYLKKAETRVTPFSSVSVYFTAHRKLLLESEFSTSTASTGKEASDIAIGIRPSGSQSGGSTRVGDSIYAILAPEEEPQSIFEESLTAYAGAPAVQRSATAIHPLIREGLLSGLLHIADGLALNISAFRDPITLALEDLTTPLFGILFTVPAEKQNDIYQLAQSMELPIARIATVIGGKEIKIPQKDRNVITLHSDFLKSLTLPRLYNASVALDDSTAFSVTLSRIGTCTLNEQKHAVVKTEAEGDYSLAASLYGILLALLHGISAGADPKAMGLACHATLPQSSPTEISDSLALLLGIYRIQTEFELCGQPLQIEYAATEKPQLSATVLAPLPTCPISSCVTGNNTRIFYLEPLYTEDGLPDFRDLKKMLDYVKALHKDGHVLSVLPTGDDLLASLETMSRNTTVEFIGDKPIVSHIGGLLVEADTELQGALIAVTRTTPSIAEEAEESSSEDSVPKNM